MRDAFADAHQPHGHGIAADHQAGPKLITIYSGDLYGKSNYQDFGRYAEVDLAIAADAEATLPASDRSMQEADHGGSQARLRGARHEVGRSGARQHASATSSWRPMAGTRARSARRACRAELWNQIKNEDWSLVSDVIRFSAAGRCGCGTSTSIISTSASTAAYGIGYGAPAAVGAALANRKHGRLTRQHPERRRLDVCSRRPVDRGASPDPAADHHAQQPRLSPGSDVSAGHGRARQSRHRTRAA